MKSTKTDRTHVHVRLPVFLQSIQLKHLLLQSSLVSMDQSATPKIRAVKTLHLSVTGQGEKGKNGIEIRPDTHASRHPHGPRTTPAAAERSKQT